MQKRLLIFHMLPSGGGIRVAEQYACALSGLFDVRVHSVSGAASFSDDSLNCTVHSFSAWRRPAGVLRIAAPVFLPVRLMLFRAFCRGLAESFRGSADIALVHNTMPLAAPPLLSFLSIPSLYYCYEYPRHIYEKDIIRRTGSAIGDSLLTPLEKIEKTLDRRATAAAGSIASLSTYMSGRIRSIYGRGSTVVRPGVRTDFFTPGRESGENFVLSVGALWPFKGHSTAIRTVAGIPKRRRPALRIVADREFPGYGDSLAKLAADLSVRLTIEKGITDKDLRLLYRRARAVLCCQRREPYGLVPLEAMSCGTPVLALNEGGFRDNVIHRETGLLFDGDPAGGAALLEELLSPRQNGLAEQARSFVCSQRNHKSGLDTLTSLLEKL